MNNEMKSTQIQLLLLELLLLHLVKLPQNWYTQVQK